MINSALSIACNDCHGYGVIFFGNENDYDCESCDCVTDEELI